uniref:Cyclin-SDS n=1 Tax=Dimocarpus longan TaxID=128017 RepID=A0A8G0QY03_9ROSI|nr:cyclin-SDS [Dimocarpus longan]
MIEPEPFIKKKLRSKRSRLPRSNLSPVLLRGGDKMHRGLSDISVDSSSCCYFADEVTSNLRRRKFGLEIGANKKERIEEDDVSFRRITRSYCKQQKEKERKGVEAEASESSCVLSDCGAVFGETNCNLKQRIEHVKKFESERSDISSVDQISAQNKTWQSDASNLKPSSENNVISFSSGVGSYSVAKQRAALKLELSEVSNNDAVDSNFTESNSECVVEQKPRSIKFDSDLVCSEQLSYDDEQVSEYSSSRENVFSQLALLEDSDIDFSDYTPSIFLESGSEFSERSIDDSIPPSRTHSLLIEFRQQFSRSTFSLDSKKCSLVEEGYQNQSNLVRFENEEEEESYQRFLDRERRQKYLHDYAEEYLSTTEFGDLILQQRSQMVHWIVEQCDAKRFQQETLFLGVGLLDRFLSRGFFKTERNLQMVGIACLALATRLEENQPYNSVRQKNFNVGINIYSRCEVVAMEWLVQEVLNFQCLLPTIYNFLWFYLKAARADAEVEKMAKYLAVLALSDQEQLCYWPSTVAAGVVILASLESHQDTSFQRVIEIHTRTKDNSLPDCIKLSLSFQVKNSTDSVANLNRAWSGWYSM